MRWRRSSLTIGRDLGEADVWFYTPLALPLLDALPQTGVVVFDVMDELSAFDFAPPELLARETRLLAAAPTSCSRAARACTAPRRTAHDERPPLHRRPSTPPTSGRR